MATAKKLPSGNYRCRIYAGEEDGKKIYKSFTAATKKEAEFLATQFLIENDNNKKKTKNEMNHKAISHFNKLYDTKYDTNQKEYGK